ncbi:hypothetical protein DPMN_087463 [Dreissena polymorpha]|uniref:Uncharacterized protein n=1 Tax=Dreissena polymorpha TaxID=45954 RepID=A0A9D4QW57_DREPO|nr:hypothetical protein DPMN_087463 [Dreissena polymorpha]
MVILIILGKCANVNEHRDNYRNTQVLKRTTSSSYHARTSMIPIKQYDLENNNVFIKTTERNGVFTNTTENDNILNNSLSQPTGANYANYTRGNISRTESVVSVPGDISYVNTTPKTLLTATEVDASESFDNSAKSDSKHKASTTESRQPLEPREVHYSIQQWTTTFIRQHKHNPRLFHHHLQLMPMDDEPFDSDLFKDHRYVLSVLVPICVVAIGAAMIMATLFSLRYIARRRVVGEFPLTDGSSMEKDAQSIARISSERTDQMLLLPVEDDVDI